MNTFSSRKFLLAVFVQMIGAYGFLTQRMNGQTYVWLASVVLGIHGTANIVDKKLNGDAQ